MPAKKLAGFGTSNKFKNYRTKQFFLLLFYVYENELSTGEPFFLTKFVLFIERTVPSGTTLCYKIYDHIEYRRYKGKISELIITGMQPCKSTVCN